MRNWWKSRRSPCDSEKKFCGKPTGRDAGKKSWRIDDYLFFHGRRRSIAEIFFEEHHIESGRRRAHLDRRSSACVELLYFRLVSRGASLLPQLRRALNIARFGAF